MAEQFNLGSLAVWVHEAESKPLRARVLVIHGINEHSGRHLNTVNYLVQRGVEVVRFDLRGSGKSGGIRQLVEKFSDYVDDTVKVFNWIHGYLENAPLFLLGHSLGGAIAVHFTALYGDVVGGLVLSAPAYKVGIGVSAPIIALGKIMSRVLPRLRLQAIKSNWISRDPQVVKAYSSDPLACHSNTARQGDEVLKALDQMPEKCREISCPVLIVHGSSDRIVLPEGSFELLKILASKNKVLHLLPGGYHESHNDIDREHYFSLVVLWIESQLAQGHFVSSNEEKLEGRESPALY